MSRAPVTALEAAWKREVPFVLGCCVVDPRRTVEARALGLRPEHLPRPMHAMWGELCRQGDDGFAELDGKRLQNFLADATGADAATTREFIRDLELDGWGRAMADHVKRLRELWVKLQLAHVTKSQAMAIEINDENGEVEYAHELGKADDLRAELAAIRVPPRTWAKVVEAAVARASDTTLRPTYPTGLHMLDEHLGGGMRPGWLVVVMGAAKAGKTALAVNGMACEAASRGHRTLVVSLEMGAEEQAARMLAREANVPIRAQTRADLKPLQQLAFNAAAARISAWPIDVITGLVTADEICNRARVHKRDHGLCVFVVDYLQLIDNGNENRVQDLERSTRKLKMLAVELDIVVVLLSQPNNQAAKGGSPGLFDGKGSGSIAADCDAMIVPLRDDNDSSRAGIDLVGCRHAEPRKWPLGTLRFEGGRALFVDPAARPRLPATPEQQGFAGYVAGDNSL